MQSFLNHFVSERDFSIRFFIINIHINKSPVVLFFGLLATVLKLKIENTEISTGLKKLFAPVLKLYGRDDVYEIIIFKQSTPIMFSDTGVVIVVSTGLIERAANDDEILGYVAHEVAHEYYAQYSIYSRYLYNWSVKKIAKRH